MQIKSQGELINEIAKRKRFLKADVKLILDGLVEVMEDVVREESNNFPEGKSTKMLLRSRGLGILYSQKIPERKGRIGEDLPATTRVVLRLSENIRYAGRGVKPEIEERLDLDNEEDM